MSFESYNHDQAIQTKEQNDAIISVNQKEINVDTIDNINEEKSKNVTETQFDQRFKQGLQNLTKGPGFGGMFKRLFNKQNENVFAKIDTNDDGKVSVGEYNNGTDLTKQAFEQDAKRFVGNEQQEVVAELNTVDEQKYDVLDSLTESIKKNEIGPLQSDIIANHPEAVGAVGENASHYAQNDPNGIVAKRNREHGVA